MPGLLCKYFCYDASRRQGTSIYIWENREAAEACYGSEGFQMGFRGAFGCAPKIEILEIRHLVDNG